MFYIIPLIIIIAILIVLNVKIVPQAHAYIIERLGRYHTTWNAGLHIKVPFIDKIANTVSLKEQVVDFEPKPVITKDNVTMKIDTVVFYSIFNSEKYTYGIDKPIVAIENLSATTLRNIIGDMELDKCLSSRDEINSQITKLIDDASDPWGIKVHRVEVKNIEPPIDVKEAMEKQMRAEREKRSVILEAEGKKRSTILRAEGEKEAKVLAAEAEAACKIRLAEAEKSAEILKAEAARESKIRIAEGNAFEIQKVCEANPNEAFIKLRAYEAFEKAADGKATKIIIPSEIQSFAGMISGIKEAIN